MADNKTVLILLLIVLGAVFLKRRQRTTLPGPPGKPIIGNLLDLNADHIYLLFHDWKAVYGDVFALNVLGSTMLVLNSTSAAVEFLERRGAKFSGRPYMPMVTELMGWDWSFAFMPMGNRWRTMRRLFFNNFHGSMPENEVPAQEESAKLVVALRDQPKEFLTHLKTYTAGLILKRTYGHNVVSSKDNLLVLVEETSKTTSIAVTPGRFWVNLFPIMKSIPEWMLPGGGFKKQAREWKALTIEMVETPFQMAKDQLNGDSAITSFVASCLESDKKENRDESLVKETAAVAYAAGADTTFSLITTFVMCMILHPDIQKRAQAEVDAHCAGRLPTLQDRQQLPFLNSVLVECLRWVPPLPIAVPHRLEEDDVYQGAVIPKGSLVVCNLWSILHDETIYPDPSSYKPDRYLSDPTLLDKTIDATFGYGRRACAGKGTALDMAWVAIAAMLAVFNISKAVDEDGREIDVEMKVQPGSASHLYPFQCKFTPRSPAAAHLIEELEQQ